MFGFIKKYLTNIYTAVSSKFSALFAKTHVSEADLKELERILLEADVGVPTTRYIMQAILQAANKPEFSGGDLKAILQKELKEILALKTFEHNKLVILFVGINGSGKTTTIAKYAHLYASQGKKVLIAAADTFRAAATEQLVLWAQRVGCAIVTGTPGQDPAAVVFRACQQFKNDHCDVLLIDTAGRLQTKVNLMNELEKIVRVIKKHVNSDQITTLLTIDGMLGQNSFDQAKLFHAVTPIDGVVLTKMDGTGKGGIVFAIARELGIAIAAIAYGESLDALKPFEANEYVDELIG